jgi:hypothetical protein
MTELQITEAGKKLVQSKEFALLVKGLAEKFKTNGISDDEAETRAISMIAWAAVGRDILKNQHPRNWSG